ncbi:GntR family transcriptional regulator [Arenibaculum pallidiluteum]|uniref:GntR family transcriptional regulator n=1 Tax=Arenibaculum pallidiluteum TaxID=2812559 RepID=UPI001A970B64|nr:GntR family transcriptional regulator [Arenibaculum pallidiluteum]
MRPLESQPSLIAQVHARLVEAITEGLLEPGERIRQDELAATLGVSRQPVSHALQLLRHQGLLEETGRRGLIVARIEPGRIRDLYQVRSALDSLAARLAAGRVAAGSAPAGDRASLGETLARGAALGTEDPVAAFVAADVAFHGAVYRLSGNAAIEETLAAQWPHLKRSMGMVLVNAGERPLVWEEHAAIADRILVGDADGAEKAARAHTMRAAEATNLRLAALSTAA